MACSTTSRTPGQVRRRCSCNGPKHEPDRPHRGRRGDQGRTSNHGHLRRDGDGTLDDGFTNEIDKLDEHFTVFVSRSEGGCPGGMMASRTTIQRSLTTRAVHDRLHTGIESPKDAQEAAGSVAASLRRSPKARSETKFLKRPTHLTTPTGDDRRHAARRSASMSPLRPAGAWRNCRISQIRPAPGHRRVVQLTTTLPATPDRHPNQSSTVGFPNMTWR